ncbi:UPC2 [[Candida] subhashii]|uniref:UPC2 n=1 Tax=[Candida] subhashii TaxID=561895 RepID=A0A8J5UZQ4_9ASCO|nr:UPC2 [[Candida] subhashii]KAG7663619.1 UPC2 [[Candida] subhashii]
MSADNSSSQSNPIDNSQPQNSQEQHTDKKGRSSTGKRKYHQKSRNGCSTCKKRRVKCDETRPICNKCKNLNLDCGYLHQDPNDSAHIQENPKSEIKHSDEPKVKKRKVSSSSISSESSNEANSIPVAQQATPSLTPSPSMAAHGKSAPQFTANGSSATTAAANNIPQGQVPQIPPGLFSNNSNNPLNALASGLLSAGNLNNLNIAHLVNNLSGLSGDLGGGLGNLASLSNLATLAQLPVDLSSLGSQIDPSILQNLVATFAGAGGALPHGIMTTAANVNTPPINSAASPPASTVAAANPARLPSAAPITPASTQNILNGSSLSNSSVPTPPPMSFSPFTQAGIPQPSTGSSHLNNVTANGHNNLQSSNNHINVNNPYENAQTQRVPNISANTPITTNPLQQPPSDPSETLNMMDLKLMFHYTSQVASTITGAGISETNIWNTDIPMLAFEHPFLMHSLLAFSATHLSRTEKGLDQCVTCHRGEALRLLREAVLNINADNTDALVASALILIMDSLANASFPSSTSPKSLPASAWIFHVKGAATILTAVWPLTEASRFYKFISVDLGDLGDIINQRVNLGKKNLDDTDRYYTDLECHDSDIADLYPVEIDSPYLITLAYLNKLHKERYKSDFILRIFAFPALLDKIFLGLLMSGDVKAMRIMRSYYKLLRSFTTEMKDKVWFLEGVSQVLPVNVEEYAGGAGGMHMMLDFLGGGPAIVDEDLEEAIMQFDPSGSLSNKLIDTDNLPSEITSSLEVMQGDNGFMNIK